ncbi:MAG: hypothetical protein IJO62_05230 [Clostridia bacterium]|nr:hypothetical protein [Clostridia bacterium]
MKKTIILCFVFFFLFSFNVSANSLSTEEFIKNQAEIAGADKLNDALPESGKNYFDKNGITAGESEWIKNISLSQAIKELWSFIKKKITAPLTTSALIVAVILVSGAISLNESSASSATALFAVTAVSAAVITAPILNVINNAVATMQSAAVFMTAFVPVFAVVIAVNGQAATSASMSGLLLGATQIVELIASHLVVPLMCGYLSVSVASGVTPLLSKTSFAESLKKLSFWIMSFVTTVFLGVLSIQTAINASADSITMRTAKFVIGSSVPMAGTVLSEALTTVTASLGMLKTSVAIYGVVACLVIFLPLLIELLLWRFSFNITALISDVMSSSLTSKLLRSIDAAVSVLIGIILLSMALFVISLSVVVSVGKV